jgi:homoserine kinase
MQGEKLAVATMLTMLPCPLGGFTLVSYSLDIIKIESPSELYATVVHPQIELKTSDARSVLKQTVSLKSAIMQWEMWEDYSRIIYPRLRLNRAFLHDEIVEPLRSDTWF